MKCQKCGINDVNVTIKQNINGNKTIYYLCSKCAEEENLIDIDGNITNMFDDMFGEFDNLISDVFSNRPNILIGPKENKKLKYSDKHKLNSYKIENIKTNENIDKKDNTQEIKMLEMKLKEAVDNENYEQAAIIRDKIKALKNK